MIPFFNQNQIQASHLARQALIYIRQSSLMQVRQHTVRLG
jgi:hypothetical protein